MKLVVSPLIIMAGLAFIMMHFFVASKNEEIVLINLYSVFNSWIGITSALGITSGIFCYLFISSSERRNNMKPGSKSYIQAAKSARAYGVVLAGTAAVAMVSQLPHSKLSLFNSIETPILKVGLNHASVAGVRQKGAIDNPSSSSGNGNKDPRKTSAITLATLYEQIIRDNFVIDTILRASSSENDENNKIDPWNYFLANADQISKKYMSQAVRFGFKNILTPLGKCLDQYEYEIRDEGFINENIVKINKMIWNSNHRTRKNSILGNNIYIEIYSGDISYRKYDFPKPFLHKIRKIINEIGEYPIALNDCNIQETEEIFNYFYFGSTLEAHSPYLTIASATLFSIADRPDAAVLEYERYIDMAQKLMTSQNLSDKTKAQLYIYIMRIMILQGIEIDKIDSGEIYLGIFERNISFIIDFIREFSTLNISDSSDLKSIDLCSKENFHLSRIIFNLLNLMNNYAFKSASSFEFLKYHSERAMLYSEITNTLEWKCLMENFLIFQSGVDQLINYQKEQKNIQKKLKETGRNKENQEKFSYARLDNFTKRNILDNFVATYAIKFAITFTETRISYIEHKEQLNLMPEDVKFLILEKCYQALSDAIQSMEKISEGLRASFNKMPLKQQLLSGGALDEYQQATTLHKQIAATLANR